MTDENEIYKENLERLDIYFPGRELLTRKEICQYTGMSRRGVADNFPYSGKYITKAGFARILAELGSCGKKGRHINDASA